MSGFGTNGADTGGGTGDSGADDFLNFSQATSMFSSGDTGLEDLWNMGDATNMFFNMDAFSSAPASAGGNSSTSAAPASTQPPASSAEAQANVDLSSLGFDMGGASMDPEAWKMLLQGDPSMDELFGGSGGAGSIGGTASAAMGPTAVAPQAMASGTLAPADLDALNKQQMPPPMPQIKSPTPTAKKPRQPKAKKASGAKVDKTKSKAKKAATPKLKSPTPQPVSALSDAGGARNGPASPASDTMRKIKPKADSVSIASPTPSAKSVATTAAASGGLQQPGGALPSATPNSMTNGSQQVMSTPQLFSPTSAVRPPPMSMQQSQGLAADGVSSGTLSM
ncbi:hypothetical protein LPJ78_003531, partial [Coemansia sp. RSA 989]